MTQPLSFAVLGHGDDASRMAELLVQHGAQVVHVGSIPTTLPGVDAVFSFTTSVAAKAVAEHVAPLIPAGTVFADFSAGTPSAKRALAELFDSGIYVDAVGRHEHDRHLDVSGPGATLLAERLSPLGFEVECVSTAPGDATARRLIRSLLAKGLAGVFIDTLWAAEALGMQGWAFEEIVREFDSASAGQAQRFLSDTASNIKRRQIDMIDVVEMLTESGYDSTMIAPIEFTYGRVLHGKKIPFSKAVDTD